MPDTTNVPTQAATDNATVDAGQKNPFDDSSWVEKLPVITPAATAPIPAATPAATASTADNEEIYDANEYLKKELGYDDWGAAKAEIETLRKLKDTTPKEEIKFANDQSKALYEAWQAGKTDEVYSYLEQEKKIVRAEKLDAAKVEDAREILKLNLQLKNKDLTGDEIDFLLRRDYSLPKKPVQTDDQTEDEHQQAIAGWNERVQEVERGMVIAAKLAKPELSKYKNELSLPQIPTVPRETLPPTPEELAAMEQTRNSYLQDVNKGLSTLKGFQAEYKDDDVTIPINYEISAEEKAALKPVLEGLYSDLGYFGKRWSNADGSFNTSLMAEDIYLLENKEKVFKKMANESGAQRLALKIKKDSNIQLDKTPQRTYQPSDQQSELVKMGEQFMLA